MVKLRTLLLLAFCMVNYISFSQNQYKETDKFYMRGDLYKVIQSDSATIIAGLETMNDYGSYYKINLYIENRFYSIYDFEPKNIKAQYIIYKGKQDKTKERNAVSFADFSKRAKRKVNTAVALASVGASMQALSSVPTQNVTYHDTSGNSSTVRVYDQYSKNRETQEDFDRVGNSEFLKKQDIDSRKNAYLLKETLFHNSELGGFVYIKYIDCNELVVDVPLNGDIFSFCWTLKGREQCEKERDDIYR